jgi:hypothetical protein
MKKTAEEQAFERNLYKSYEGAASRGHSRRGTGQAPKDRERRSTVRKENSNTAKNKKTAKRKKDFKIGPANIDNLDESINDSDEDTEFLRLGPEEAHPVGPNGESSSGGTLPMAKHMLAK